MSKRSDAEPGLDRVIMRRDFVRGVSFMAGGAFVPGADRSAVDRGSQLDMGSDWYGPGGVGEYASSRGKTPA